MSGIGGWVFSVLNVYGQTQYNKIKRRNDDWGRIDILHIFHMC